MKLIFVFILSFFSFFQSELETLRNSYAVANLSKENTKSFINLAEKKTATDPVTLSYKAAAKIMEAKVATEIKKKKSFVKSGAEDLESLLKNNPNNIELRLIRLSVQENLPKIVGYHRNMKEDKTYILSNYGKQNTDLKNYIKRFASQSKTITAAEKASLK